MRMRHIITAMLMLTLLSGGTHAKAMDYQVYRNTGQKLTTMEAADLSAAYDVIVFGEYHDNDVLHQLELELLQGLFAVQPRLTVSLEMFERDVQVNLDAYLAGRTSEQEFLDTSRPWKNYREAYRPLVEFAKQHSLPVLAANVPRPLAAHVARTGSVAGIPTDKAVYLPRKHVADKGEYREKFIAYMSNSNMAGMRFDSDRLENFYKAQCLKDDAMAESISDHLRQQPGRTVIHYQGDFHSRQRLGVVEKLQRLNPEVKILVIAPVYAEDLDKLGSSLQENQTAGDILVFVRAK